MKADIGFVFMTSFFCALVAVLCWSFIWLLVNIVITLFIPFLWSLGVFFMIGLVHTYVKKLW